MIILNLFYLSGDAAHFCRSPLPRRARFDCVARPDAQSRCVPTSSLLERSIAASLCNVHSIPWSGSDVLARGSNGLRQSRPCRRGAGNTPRPQRRAPSRANSGDYLWRSSTTVWTWLWMLLRLSFRPASLIRGVFKMYEPHTSIMATDARMINCVEGVAAKGEEP